MTNRSADSSSQGDGHIPPPPAGGPPDQQRSRAGNVVFKSGPLFLSSKGIGWTSWKKRWFILTRTSLVFFRSDPNAVPQKGSEVNLALGGIDLNNSGSVVVKEDKKLITVVFPDGRDGRTFTLKAETSEDLHDWKAALENALTQAPSAALVVGQNGIFKQDQTDSADGSLEQVKDKLPSKSVVVGRPILLALEDIDGTPSFLEKALRFIEVHGVKVEGILRQAADVDDVEHRVREYEQGKTEFSSTEDPHIVADCVKHILRELPSSPVPASCCNALLEACRTDRVVRLTAMRAAICETFPEPNRRLLERILTMMQIVASNKTVNRMSSSAVAACMAPLLLRPLLAGDCELENDFDVGGDGSVQLLQAAAAANHAQAIVITLLEEYDKIFGEGSVSPDLYSDSEDSGSESGEQSDDDDESFDDDENGDITDDVDEDTDELEHASSGSYSEDHSFEDVDSSGDKSHDSSSSKSDAHGPGNDLIIAHKSSSSSPQDSLSQNDNLQTRMIFPSSNSNSETEVRETEEPHEGVSAKLAGESPSSCMKKSSSISDAPVHTSTRRTFWGRKSEKKNMSTESIDYPLEDEAEIQRLEDAKIELQNRIKEEAKRNNYLQEGLERRKKELRERRLALEQDVAGLQKQLQKEKDLRMNLEAGLKMAQGPSFISSTLDEKMKADFDEVSEAEADVCNLKQKFDNLELQLNQQREQNRGHAHSPRKELRQTSNHHKKQRDKHKDVESSAASLPPERSSKNKVQGDSNLDGLDIANENHAPQVQQLDTEHRSNSDSSGVSVNSSTSEPPKSAAQTNPKKSGKGEGANSTTSALSKLTTRLNFLKERRTQIANELQNFDKGRASGQPTHNLDKGKGPVEPSQTHQPTDERRETQCPFPQNLSSEKARGSDSAHPPQNVAETTESFEEKIRRSDTHPVKIHESRRRTRGPSGQNSERGGAENQQASGAERGRGSEAPSRASPRTNSR